MVDPALLLLVALIAAIFYLLYTQYKLERELSQLLGLFTGLRMRVFEQEVRQLSSAGIFVHEDTASQLASLALSLIDDEQRSELEQSYKSQCPSHIPFWKYFLYNYTFSLSVRPRYSTAPVTSVPHVKLGEFTEAQKRLRMELRDLESHVKRVSEELAKGEQPNTGPTER